MLIPYTILEECLVLGSNLVCSGASSYSFLSLKLVGVSGQRHVPAALYPQGKDVQVSIVQEAGWAPEPVWTQRLEKKKILGLFWGSNPDRPVTQSAVGHYTY
jgi:hypothetical protein